MNILLNDVQNNPAAGWPLVVDLDGTLTPTDTLLESIIQLIKQSPLNLLRLPFWLMKGRAAFKDAVCSRTTFSAARLPYREAFLAYLQNEKNKGRRIILATAAHQSIAQRVSDHLGLFDDVLASDTGRNLKGNAKLEAIQQKVGAEFAYAGDSRADMPIWNAAQAAILVGASAGLSKSVRERSTIEQEFPKESIGLSTWARALRVHQWLKNLLLFVPLLTAFSFMDIGKLATIAPAFLSFSFAASATYLVNDLWDLESDRAHPRKKNRPFASARIPIPVGLVVAGGLLMLAFMLALAVSQAFSLVLLLYVILTSTYSWMFKEYVLIDVIMLSLLYTLRILAGSVAIAVITSAWLLAFSAFMFLSLALVKRCAELIALEQNGGGCRTRPRLPRDGLGRAMSAGRGVRHVRSGCLRAVHQFPGHPVPLRNARLVVAGSHRADLLAGPALDQDLARRNARRSGDLCDQGPWQSQHRHRHGRRDAGRALCYPRSTHMNLSEKHGLAWILAFAFLVRAATAFAFQFQPVSDYAGYERMAVNLLAGKGLLEGGNSAFLNAGYPLFVLAPVFAVFGHHLLAALFANAMLCTVSAWLVYLIAEEAGAGKLGRLVSAGLYALYLPSWIYAAYLAKENLMTPLMLAAVLLCLRCTYHPSARVAISAGAVFGMLAITGNSGLALSPVLAVALMISPLSYPRKLARLGLAGLVAMLVIAPWLVRNYQVLGAPVLNTNGGFNLYLANNPSANGMYISIADTPRGSTWQQLRKQGEVAANSTLKHEALAWIWRNPSRFLTLSLKKAALFWMPPVHEGEGPPSKGEALARLAWLAQYLSICGLALAGMAYRRLRGPQPSLLWLAVLCYTAVHMIFFVIYRYREPIMPLLMVLAALVIDFLISDEKFATITK